MNENKTCYTCEWQVYDVDGTMYCNNVTSPDYMEPVGQGHTCKRHKEGEHEHDAE